MLRNILAITGKPGLYKLVSRGNNMLIVESLVDGKRMPTYARDKIVALSDISMFTEQGRKKGSSLLLWIPRKLPTTSSTHGSMRYSLTGIATAFIRPTYASSSNGTISS